MPRRRPSSSGWKSSTAKWEIEVLYGVFSLLNHQVSMPVNPRAPVHPDNVNLAYAPTNPREFSTIASGMADLLKPASHTPAGSRENAAANATGPSPSAR